MVSANIGNIRSGDHPVEVVRVSVLDDHVDEIARFHPRRHVPQEHLSVDLRRIRPASPGRAGRPSQSTST